MNTNLDSELEAVLTFDPDNKSKFNDVKSTPELIEERMTNRLTMDARCVNGKTHLNRGARRAIRAAKWEFLARIGEQARKEIAENPKKDAIFPPSASDLHSDEYELSTPAVYGKYIHEYNISPSL